MRQSRNDGRAIQRGACAPARPRAASRGRTVDTLRLMLDVGNITQAMHDPARDFQAAFTIASLDRMPSASLVLVQPPGTRGSGDLAEALGRRARARRTGARCAWRPRIAGRLLH